MHTLVSKLVALHVEKYYVALTEIQVKICRFHGSLSQKGSDTCYKRIEMHIKDAITAKHNVTLWANWRYRGSRYKRIQLYRTDLHKVSGPVRIKLKVSFRANCYFQGKFFPTPSKMPSRTPMFMSQRHSTKTLTGLQNKTKYPTTENKRITEIVGSHEIILLWSVMNMVCYESGLFLMVCYEWSVMNVSVLNGNDFEALLCFISHDFHTVCCNWVQRKSPLILNVVVAVAYVATILTSKIKI